MAKRIINRVFGVHTANLCSSEWCHPCPVFAMILFVFDSSRPGNFTANEGKIYCKTHYMQLFKVNGNYKSGFSGETNLTGATVNNNGAAAAAADQ